MVVDPEESLLRELEREVVGAIVATPANLLGIQELSRAVVVVRFTARIDPEVCRRVVSWSAERRPRPGLIGWAPNAPASDAEVALDAGFDDVVAGGCSPRELAARVRAVHRRVHWNAAQRTGRIRWGGMMLDTDGQELWIDGKAIPLTGTEMSVVRALMRAGGKTLSRAELLDHAWGSANFEISERAVDNVILRLRRKLGASDVIRTVRGVGFRLHAER